MKQLLISGLLLLMSHVAMAADKPANLDELLDQVKRERVLEQQQNKLREAEFVQAHESQVKLLSDAKSALAFEERRTDTLNQQFNDLEKQLAELQAQLQEKSGSLGELFGTVRQVANDSRSVIQSSMMTVTNPDRITFLDNLGESKEQPTIDDLRTLWLSIQEEMTESGKVAQFEAPVITVTGEVEQRNVTRVGVFTAFSEGHYLRYLPETGDLVELARQPVDRLRRVMVDFSEADASNTVPAVIDPTRGAIMALLVQKPTLQERIQQGGWIGYLILIIGVIGLVVALFQFLSLFVTGRGIAQQQADNTTPNIKNPLGRVLSVYSESLAKDVETLTLKLDEAILRETPKLERGLITLAILAAIAPMLGLLGTVSGMIETFQSITLFGTGDPKLMSGGISQALVTTELGLAVAIPLLLIHSGLSSKSNRLIQILDEESAAIIARNAEKQA
jgi:biopolymer transport protein ExbB